MNRKKYIKKVIVSDKNSSPELRAERLRKVRNLANLSRKDLCNTEFLKLNTYKGWELGRFGGLPCDGAERIVQRVAKENVICTAEWLLYGKGIEPYILPKAKKNDLLDESDSILKEITLFQNLNPESTFTEIIDDALSPQFIPGEYVAGIKLYGDDIASAINQSCIVELSNGETLVRYVKKSSEKNKFQLLATNIESSLFSSHLIETTLNFAAPIIRHYKNILI